MTPSRSSSPEEQTDVFSLDTSLIPPRENKVAGTTSITFDGILPCCGTADSSYAHGAPLLLHEDLQEGCGGQLWPAGMVLSKYMLTHHKTQTLRGKSVVEIGAGGGLVGLAVALGCEVDADKPIYITDQVPMFALMQKNIALNNLQGRVKAEVYDWGTPPPAGMLAPGQYPDVVLAADCVYFEPAFPLLLTTLQDLIGPSTTCYFCFKKRRKADMRFIRAMMKKFAVEHVQYDGREADQREGIFLYTVQRRR
ncbi:hypothetical protein PV08_08421 [Exophiala spinifera]|uniref:Protein-lysine N-methyltransferase EFM6 n=1 Tax=Exophiala spinifera TaxID=91928 RepID=A0A0D2BQ25_9EURO|nr:uncharacterized protein PV08_08421 [Exophiala spinifera]KIW13234.1 hypothetical protein PV08_08421 [Exophiala spinifera]